MEFQKSWRNSRTNSLENSRVIFLKNFKLTFRGVIGGTLGKKTLEWVPGGNVERIPEATSGETFQGSSGATPDKILEVILKEFLEQFQKESRRTFRSVNCSILRPHGSLRALRLISSSCRTQLLQHSFVHCDCIVPHSSVPKCTPFPSLKLRSYFDSCILLQEACSIPGESIEAIREATPWRISEVASWWFAG